MLAFRAHEKGLELACDIEAPMAQSFIGDAGRIRQVLVNLIGNAIQFTERGEIVVTVRSKPRPAPHQVELYFEVRDTGIGIAAGKQRVIFQAFEQADGSMTRRFGGTGLGLTISARLVNIMGGELRVESELGEGSAFSFAIVAGVDGNASAPFAGDCALLDGITALVASRADSPPRILLAEDNVVNQRVAAGILQSEGYEVVVAGNGREALAALQRSSFDVILMDVQMPELDGYEATAAIRSQERHTGARTPIVALTAHTVTGDRDRCLAAGMDGYISKPFRRAHLIAEIERVAGSGKGGLSGERAHIL
jgi:CheY-like chemotaxis protein